MQAAVENALSLKIDGLTSLTRQIGKDVQINTAAVEALTESMKLASNSMESMAEAFRELTERITAEPDEENAVHALLERIDRTGTAIYKLTTEVLGRLPAPAKK